MTEHHHPLFNRVRLVDNVAAPGVTHRLGRLRRIQVAGEQDGVVRHLGEPPGERVVQLLGVATGKVSPTASVEEQCVAGDQMVLHQETLAARGVAGGMDELDLDLADLDFVSRGVGDKLVWAEPGGFCDELKLWRLEMDRHVGVLQQIGDPGDVVAHHVPADVVGVVVGTEHTGAGHAIRVENGHKACDVIGRINDHRFPGLAITDQVGEVHHLLGDHVVRGEVTAAQELSEIETIFHGFEPRLNTVTNSTPRIAYLGPAGTFTEQALMSQADLISDELVPMPKFVDVLDATSSGDVEHGFVAIENAIEGTVNVTLDALAFDHELLIQREVVLDIRLNLMAAPGVKISDIDTVYSHPVANAQCRGFLHKELPDADVKAANSTSEAAVMAIEQPGLGALAPSLAAEKHGLELLATDIADHPGNQTRFVLVAPSGVPAPTGHDKTTVVLTQRADKPGSLVAILQEFAARNINLSRLSSRPVKTELGNYCFIIDLDGHIGDDVVANCLRNVRAKHADVKFLGSYPAAGKGSTEVRDEANASWTEAADWMRSLRAQMPNK